MYVYVTIALLRICDQNLGNHTVGGVQNRRPQTRPTNATTLLMIGTPKIELFNF